MRATAAILLIASFSLAAPAADTVKDIDELATHHQAGVIEIADDHNPLNINAFCLDSQGRIVAVCGNGPGEIRVVNDQGEIVRSWKIEVKPEAVNVADDGTILVGGEGKLFRFDDRGNQVLVADSPHAVRLQASGQQLRKAAIEYLERRRNPLKLRIVTYETVIAQLEARAVKGELNPTEERMLETLPKTLERYREQFATLHAGQAGQSADQGPSEEAIQTQIKSLISSKMRISAVTSSGDQVFVATRGIEGYGYDVWKMNSQFTDAEVIVTGLSGCCGQMDVQCCPSGLFVAENSRDRVVHFDTQGNQVTQWGKSDRTGIDGFTSCCNPMNVCFDADGHVYTAESTSGRIKQFTADGELVAYIGDVDLVPGCKNVSIAVSPVNDNIYMLDLTRNHIKLMKPKPADAVKELKQDGDAKPKQSAHPTTPQRSFVSSIVSIFGFGGNPDE